MIDCFHSFTHGRSLLQKLAVFSSSMHHCTVLCKGVSLGEEDLRTHLRLFCINIWPKVGFFLLQLSVLNFSMYSLEQAMLHFLSTSIPRALPYATLHQCRYEPKMPCAAPCPSMLRKMQTEMILRQAQD